MTEAKPLQTETKAKFAHNLELQTANHYAKVSLHQKGAQITSAAIDGFDILFGRQGLRALSEKTENALGRVEIDSTGEGGTWPAFPFGRNEGLPIH